jgi:hypothetical protein
VKREVVVSTKGEMTDIDIYVPDVEDEFDVPDAAMFLLACALRWKTDKAFVQTMIRWFDSEIEEKRAPRSDRLH